MLRKTIITAFLLIFAISTSLTSASDADYYITVGRSLMFEETLSGIRLAYETFDNGLNDPECTDCNTSRELKFLHAITHTAMLAIRDDDGSTDSALELASQFNIELVGDYLDLLDVNYPLNQHDAYEIPDGAPDANEIAEIINTWTIPEVNEIINDLNSIGDSPGDRFRIFFHPDETGLVNDLEVDYSEVLLLKALLAAVKAQLQARVAHDFFIDANDMPIEKAYGKCFNINTDLLDPYPDFLKVLPTPNYPDVNGKAILAQAASAWIDAINYYFDAINYMASENVPPGTDPQEDEILYIDPNDRLALDLCNEKVTELRNSLVNDVPGTYPWETTKTYNILDVNAATIGQLALVFDMTGVNGEDGSLVFAEPCTIPSPWEVDSFGISGGQGISSYKHPPRPAEIWIEMDYDVPGEWGGAYFEGTVTDGNSITMATFEYWGPAYDTLYGLSAQIVSTEVEERQLDTNPLFGSSPRYPDPLNPRDLLPELDQWNGPQPDTVGHGLSDDATLGGVTPDMTQYEWQVFGNLQPGGLFYLPQLYGWQLSGGWVGFWLDEQIVLSDISGDTDQDDDSGNTDIHRLYMGYTEMDLYGALTFYDNNDWSQNRIYDLYMSYHPDDKECLGSIKIMLSVIGGTPQANLYQKVTDDYWQLGGSPAVQTTDWGIEFRIPWYDIPYLPGRFIALSSKASDDGSYWTAEKNNTHLQMGRLGTISGTVSYNGYKGAPIFVQAYTDPFNPKDSVVATTMITQPGPYTLEGIGLGWEGSVRAFTPLFGFENIFELEGGFDIEDSQEVFLWQDHLEDVDIVLNYPEILEKDVWTPGVIDPCSEVDWYAFDAVEGGTYTLDVNRGTSAYACITLYGRDADSELQKLDYWQTQQINWLCPIAGRYYVKVDDGYHIPDGGTYQIRMTTDLTCPQTDIACADWVGVKDCKVDFYDLAALLSNWLNSCSDPYWCDDSDFNESGSVDSADFATLANEWLQDGSP